MAHPVSGYAQAESRLGRTAVLAAPLSRSTKPRLHEYLWAVDQERASRLERFGIGRAHQTPNIPVLRAVLIDERRLVAAKYRVVDSQGRQLLLVRRRDIHGKIEAVSRGLHAAMAEEQPVDLMRFGPVECAPVRELFPICVTARRHAVDHDVGHGRAIWVHAGSRPVVFVTFSSSLNLPVQMIRRLATLFSSLGSMVFNCGLHCRCSLCEAWWISRELGRSQ